MTHNLSAELLWSLCLFSLVTSVTPGPNNMMLLASGVNFGFKASVSHMAGISCGFWVMLVAVGFGLTQVFDWLPWLYQVMKWSGVIYMAYLAYKISQSTDAALQHPEASQPKPLGFWAAAAFQWVNPKAIVMAITYYSTYVPNGRGSWAILLTATIFAVINFPCVGSWALLGQHLRRFLSDTPKRRIFNYFMGLLLLVSIFPVFFAAP
jgi:threonine/homoserine/homoserine lactone efflux protein